VVSAFGAAGDPVPLEGGQGSSWLVDDLVLKPLDLGEPELAWQAEVLEAIRDDSLRIAQPRRSRGGSLVVDGWCAWTRLAGRHESRRWREIIAAGERFHAALATVPRPDFLDERSDPWAVGDRVAWGELPAEEFGNVKHLPRLAAALHPVEASSQLIHGDLTGNVLFDEGLPPAIIDFSPYWRPMAFASAIVVADALVWEGADERILEDVEHIAEFGQFLLRALIYRAVTDRVFRKHEPIRPDETDPYRPAVELACGLVGG
jgi:uncharacterized protein (TIGR02569 family)